MSIGADVLGRGVAGGAPPPKPPGRFVSPDVQTPHLTSPFRIDGVSANYVEQGGDEEIVQNCVVILRTPYGSREDDPDFGLEPQVFSSGGKSARDVETALSRDEPRARFLTDEILEKLTRVIDVKVLTSEAGQ